MKGEEHETSSQESNEREERAAWGRRPPRPLFVALETTGPDPAIDDLIRIRASRGAASADRRRDRLVPSRAGARGPSRRTANHPDIVHELERRRGGNG